MMYIGQHSITYGNKNTWTDWRLVPSESPVFLSPEFKSAYVDIPGSSTTLDLSTTLTGFPTFKQREGSHSFIFHPDYHDVASCYSVYSDILNYLHGRRFDNVRLTNDPNYRYSGRFNVGDLQIGSELTTIELSYHVDPYKYHLTDAKTEYPDYIKEYEINGKADILKDTDVFHLRDCVDAMPISPKISITLSGNSKDMGVHFYNKELGMETDTLFKAGQNMTSSNIILTNMSGNNEMGFTIEGTGKFSLNYVNGRL